MFELIYNFLNGAEMNEGNNIDSLLDRRIKDSLDSETSEMFSEEVMKRIYLNLEFQKEDKKTFRFAGIISVSVIAAMFVIAVFISTIAGFSSGDEKTSESGTFIQNIYNFFSDTFLRLFAAIGLQGTTDSLLYIILISFVILIFFFADKLIPGKKNQ
jgi:hypothetical protein